MSSKNKILERIKSCEQKQVDMPKFDIETNVSSDKVSDFTVSVEQVGGKVVLLEEYGTIDNVIAKLFPDAKRIASNLPGIDCITENPDDFSSSAQLNGVDVGIIEGHFGVLENGAIWVTKEVKYKALFFISEALVIILDKENLVENMHYAYKRPELYGDFEYGCFISGPSKTADIEQALVIGAHGARAVTVILK